MKQFGTYKEAQQYAQEEANAQGRDLGIEKGTAWDRGKFNVIGLPAERFRSGHELRCEVVRPMKYAVHVPSLSAPTVSD